MTETTYDIDVNGFKLHVAYSRDADSDPPWDQGDGNGRVRKCGTPHWNGEGQSTKRPGERPLNKPARNRYQYYYDWQEACKRARAEKWNAPPYDAPNQVLRTVQADFDYMQQYVDGDWEYVVVTVSLANRPEYSQSIGGVETFKDYHLEFAKELAQEVIDDYLDDMEENKLKGMKDELRECMQL